MVYIRLAFYSLVYLRETMEFHSEIIFSFLQPFRELKAADLKTELKAELKSWIAC